MFCPPHSRWYELIYKTYLNSTDHYWFVLKTYPEENVSCNSLVAFIQKYLPSTKAVHQPFRAPHTPPTDIWYWTLSVLFLIFLIFPSSVIDLPLTQTQGFVLTSQSRSTIFSHLQGHLKQVKIRNHTPNKSHPKFSREWQTVQSSTSWSTYPVYTPLDGQNHLILKVYEEVAETVLCVSRVKCLYTNLVFCPTPTTQMPKSLQNSHHLRTSSSDYRGCLPLPSSCGEVYRREPLTPHKRQVDTHMLKMF